MTKMKPIIGMNPANANLGDVDRPLRLVLPAMH